MAATSIADSTEHVPDVDNLTSDTDEDEKPNTKAGRACSLKVFRQYLRQNNIDDNFEHFSCARLDGILARFFAEVRTKTGEAYKISSLHTIRVGIGCHLKKFNRSLNLGRNPEFRSSQQSFKAVRKALRQEGKGTVDHRYPLSPEDLRKMYAYLSDISEPIKLLQKVFVDIKIYFHMRSRKVLRCLKKSDFELKEEANHPRYIRMTEQAEQTANHSRYMRLKEQAEETANHPKYIRQAEQTAEHAEEGRQQLETRLYETPGLASCPVLSFMKYISKSNQASPWLFQMPKRQPILSSDQWYTPSAMGHNTLGNMMSVISKAAKLSTLYTNHSLTTTSGDMLNQANYRARTSYQHVNTNSSHPTQTSSGNIYHPIETSSGNVIHVGNHPEETGVNPGCFLEQLSYGELLEASQSAVGMSDTVRSESLASWTHCGPSTSSVENVLDGTESSLRISSPPASPGRPSFVCLFTRPRKDEPIPSPETVEYLEELLVYYKRKNSQKQNANNALSAAGGSSESKHQILTEVNDLQPVPTPDAVTFLGRLTTYSKDLLQECQGHVMGTGHVTQADQVMTNAQVIGSCQEIQANQVMRPGHVTPSDDESENYPLVCDVKQEMEPETDLEFYLTQNSTSVTGFGQVEPQTSDD